MIYTALAFVIVALVLNHRRQVRHQRRARMNALLRAHVKSINIPQEDW